MALPLAPIALVALRYGAVAVATYAVVRNIDRAPRDQRAESAMDEVHEGLAARREPDQLSGTARWRRVVRLGSTGPGVEIDMTALGRLRFRRVGRGG